METVHRQLNDFRPLPFLRLFYATATLLSLTLQRQSFVRCTILHTILCRSELAANDILRRYYAPQPFLILRLVPILCQCDAFVTNFTVTNFSLPDKNRYSAFSPAAAVVCSATLFILFDSDELLDSVISDCFGAESTMGCVKVKVLSYLDTKLGVETESARAFQQDNIDKVIFDRAGKILNSNEFRLQLPEFIFQNAEISYRSDRGFDIQIPETENDNGEARGLLKKKLLLPVLLLLKLKMKALMPILVSIIGIKAIKALILSKLAIVLVVGFLVYNLLQKKGMPMMMMPTEPPMTQYGPPSSQYGAPAAATAAPAPADSYSPQWEPASSGPYARVWDPSQLAYSSYYPGDSSSQSPSYSSAASISSVASSSSSSPSK
ncbi:hypothetical protein EVAR_82791_1 [Eumeta japonica]|uniref:Osiris 20 n=1 Tax=Eumeta variegata TaxID=151549 RepID=A0A4C1UP47_EUMVA|nr:hypothetical protein EVAR_82791_1 [Eumeta japonica]